MRCARLPCPGSVLGVSNHLLASLALEMDRENRGRKKRVLVLIPCVCTHACEKGGACAPARVLDSEHCPVEPFLSFLLYTGSGNQTHITRLSWQALYWLSHLISPRDRIPRWNVTPSLSGVVTDSQAVAILPSPPLRDVILAPGETSAATEP